MAWIEWHTSTKGARTATVRWRNSDGTKGRKALGQVHPRIAEAERSHAECVWEGVAPSQMMRVDALQALDLFLAHMKDIRGCKPVTVKFTDTKVRPTIEALGPERWKRWVRQDVERHFARLPNSPSGKRRMLAELRRFIRWAIEEGAPVRDCTIGVRLPRSVPIHRSALSPEQVQAVVEASQGHPWLEAAVCLAAYCGLSWGDLRTLKWDEVDLDGAMIRRRRSKTEQIVAVPLVPDAVATLRREFKRQGRPRSGRVCRRIPKSKSSAVRALHRLQSKAGIPRAERGQNGWHRYRRSLATTLRRRGVSGTVIARILSHAEGSTMWRIYDVVDEHDTRAAMRLIQDAYSPTGTN